MDEAHYHELVDWITRASLRNRTEPELVSGFCERMVAGGTPLARASIIMDALHPLHKGRGLTKLRTSGGTPVTAYERGEPDAGHESWKTSPFFYLLESGALSMRERLTQETDSKFPIYKELREAGATDYLVLKHPFRQPDSGEGILLGALSSWSTDSNRGFSDEDVAEITRLSPLLALALKGASLADTAETLVETYLGRDAGRRVLRGAIARGVADRIDSVLWFSDLRGFTTITDSAEPEQIIPLLNDYADAIVSAIHANGGDVMKFMGDGVLAIFPTADRRAAARGALSAVRAARMAIGELNKRRAAASKPTTDMYIGLHAGEVFYGNIGSKDRLDFTVVGPAVNEASRIVAMCRSVDQSTLISSAFAAALDDADGLVSVGRFALRGVAQPQNSFTLDPAKAKTAP